MNLFAGDTEAEAIRLQRIEATSAPGGSPRLSTRAASRMYSGSSAIVSTSNTLRPTAVLASERLSRVAALLPGCKPEVAVADVGRLSAPWKARIANHGMRAIKQTAPRRSGIA